jgi:chemotaxis protein methyltransferase CheR
MTRPIEDTLALLNDAMSAHRDALAREPEQRQAFQFSGSHDPRQELVLRLLAGVEQRAGIAVSQSTAEKVARAVSHIELAELKSAVLRLELLPTSDPEWQTFIESLTVQETYIMRDPSQLRFFVALLPMLIEAAAATSHRLRIWSVGCASGEETYSIAALILDALVQAGHAEALDGQISLRPPWQLEVVGADISKRALKRAGAAVYETGPLSSFRSEATALLHHFPINGHATKNASLSRAASPALKKVVRFEHFNLMDGELPAQPYDAIFCRNVFIYFSDRARQHAQARLSQSLRAGGLLLLGPTDGLVNAAAYDTLWASDAVINRRRDARA